jgi:hypothetical protein
MKVIVKRELTGGQYRISFTVTEFTEDDRERFSKFGVPVVTMTLGQQGGPMQRIAMPVTAIRPEHMTVFTDPQSARGYELSVLQEIQTKMAALKELTDDFSGADEVIL